MFPHKSSLIKDTLPGALYEVRVAGSAEGARLFTSRLALLDHARSLLQPSVELTVAEVGVFHGHFSEHLLSVLRPKRLHLIDTFSTRDHISDLFDAEGHLAFVANRFSTREEVTLHQGLSWECVAALPDASVDYMYIDAGHEYAQVKLDTVQALSKMREGGIIQFNDYTNAHGYGVLEVVNEVLESCPNVTLVGMSLDRSGYHDIAVRVENNNFFSGRVSAEDNRLSIVTPCSRPENLEAMRSSIDFSRIDAWFIVHDTRTRPFTRVFPETENKIVELECKDAGVAGHPIRNFALDHLVKSGMIYFLDDDNLVHPDFWKLNFEKGKINTFDMQYSTGRVVLGNVLQVTKIDTAQLVIDVSIIPMDLRFNANEYTADGIFAETLHKTLPPGCLAYHPYIAAWYNKLRYCPPISTMDTIL